MSEVVATEDVLTRQQQKADPLWAKHIKVYAKGVSGRWRTIKTATLIVLLLIYYTVPWIRWDRGEGVPNQAVLADMANSRLYFFWIEIWPQEIYYLTGLLIMAAFGLFMASALFGRVWCGFTCPQTVWTDLFMFVERRIEGDRNQRMRLDRQPWTVDKVRKRISKHIVWLVIALATGGAWIFYFMDAPSTFYDLVTFQASGGTYFFMLLFTGTTYLLAGFAREQVCTYMCPWPRIQAALLDEHSLTVTYQKYRGEPRGSHRKGESWEGRGHCIDCRQCVSVCPMGIDIRDGMQLECIGCGLCIDACDTVMDKVDLPRGLISFDTEMNQHAKSHGDTQPVRLIRPRTIIYTVIVSLVGLLMLFGLSTKSTADITVQRDRNPLFIQLSDGSIRNGYTVKILNKKNEERQFLLAMTGLEGVEMFEQGGNPQPALALDAAPDGVSTFRIFVTQAADDISSDSYDVAFEITAMDTNETVTHETVFRTPGP
ncbi:MAG: cytochrome c oxidase accessory protein CcoG [Geminicoccaceae bacterium]